MSTPAHKQRKGPAATAASATIGAARAAASAAGALWRSVRGGAERPPTGAAAAQAGWYESGRPERHVRQVVVRIPGSARAVPTVGDSVNPQILTGNWMHMPLLPGTGEEDEEPFILVGATGVTDELKGRPVQVAFGFYEMEAGGLLVLLVHVDSPDVQSLARRPFVTEFPYSPENQPWRETIERLLGASRVEVCFVAPGEHGPGTCHFAVAADLPPDCREALRRCWASLLEYHAGVPADRRDGSAALAQYRRENPLSRNPILPEPTAGSEPPMPC